MSEEAKSNLPKGIEQEEYDKAKAVIVSGFKSKADADTIKTAMFEQGIPFSNLLRLYKAITINEGLVISPKAIKAGLEEFLANVDFTQVTEYDHVQQIVDKALETVEGATEKRTVSAIRKLMAGLDLECPKKPRKSDGGGGARVSKINTAIVDFFKGNPAGTVEEFTAMIGGVTTEKSAKKWIRMFKMFSALANGKTSAEGLA